MNIQFDDANLRAAMVGEAHGLKSLEIKAEHPLALTALAGFKKVLEEGRYGGFPHLPFQSEVIKDVEQYAGAVRGSFDTVCVVGIGGSALGAWALDCGLRGPHPVQKAFGPKNARMVILDNVDPALVAAALDSMNPKKTLAVVISKSGEAAETVGTFLIVREWLGRGAAKRIAAVTSESRGDLVELARREKYRTFHIPGNVGGRFSVLSPVGLLPAALAGINIRKLCKGAAGMTHSCWQPDLAANIALRSALMHYLIWTRKNKPIHVAFPYSSRLWGTAFWFRQLWAESLGKARTRKDELVNVGQTPVAALGTTDQHSQVQLYMEGPNDKVHTFWTIARAADPCRIPRARLGLEGFDALGGQSLKKLIDAEQRSTAAALAANHRPNCMFTLDRMDEEHLGAFLQLLEFQAAFVGEMLGINAFDQPGVELGKRYTWGLMGRKGFEAYGEEFQRYETKRAAARG